MKKFLAIILALTMILTMSVTALAVEPEPLGSDVQIELFTLVLVSVVRIATTIAITLVTVGGAWLTYKMSKVKGLEAITLATDNVIKMAKETAKELQQTAVENLKASTEDGKLTSQDMQWLSRQLLDLTKAKLSVAVYDLINAAGADIEAIILGAGEAWLTSLKNGLKE